MTISAKAFEGFLADKLHLGTELSGLLSTLTIIIALIAIGVGINWICQWIFRWISGRSARFRRSRWHPYLVKHKLGHHILLLVPGLLLYLIPDMLFERGSRIIRLFHRADIIYIIIVLMMIINAFMLAFLDAYSKTDKNKKHPLQGLVQGLQVILYFVGGIIIVAVLIDKSPTVLLTGLGASAAVLMLIFKDSILGFVAGVQLSQNNMIKLGDWIQMPDGSANGTVEEITLNTVKVRNWDNTLTMIPPYTLVSTPFKNWRGMQESGGRRVDKEIFIDLNCLEILDTDRVTEICGNIPSMAGYIRHKSGPVTNIQLYRDYIEIYLRNNPEVNQKLDMIITQKEVTPYGLPIEVYFFLTDKAWASYEKKQSDVFDHLMTMAPTFGLKLYQRP